MRALAFTFPILVFLASAVPRGAVGEVGGHRQELAGVRLLATEVAFEPLVDAAGWRLVVSGPGDLRYVREDTGAPPSIRLRDLEQPTGGLFDGAYVYELVLPPLAEAGQARRGPIGAGRLAVARDRRRGAHPRCGYRLRDRRGHPWTAG